jgi:hypothetical protein
MHDAAFAPDKPQRQHSKNSSSLRLTCMKPLKGASPVPGPTMTTDAAGLAGSLKVLFLMNTGTRSPTAHCCR